MRVISRRRIGKAVRQRGAGTKGVVGRWPGAGLVALQFPYFCFVVEGEADIAVGDAIVLCPAGHGILIPPGTPLTDGISPHWHRPAAERAHSDILWMLLRPFGVEYHLCHTRGSEHLGGGFGERGYIANRQIFTLGEMLIDEVTQRHSEFETLGSAYLLSLLMLLQRHLENDEALPHLLPPTCIDEQDNEPSDPHQTVLRAQKYIQDNLGKTLNLQEIAHAAYVSRANLAGLFRAQTGMTVWEYVTERRIEEAKSLLAETNISIDNVGRIIGFPGAAYFCTRFAQMTGQSPGAFRNQCKAEGANEIIWGEPQRRRGRREGELTEMNRMGKHLQMTIDE